MLFSLVFFLAENPAAFAVAPQGTAERKLQRGLLNVVFAPVEISQALSEEKSQRNEFPSWATLGLGRGVWFACLRALTGVYEILTFPLPVPPHYEAIFQPEFALEHLGSMKDEPQLEKKAP